MAEPTSTTTAKGVVTITEPTRAQHLTGRRAAEAKATVPDFAVGAELDLEALVAHHTAAGAQAPSVTALLVRAAALALREHPRLNAAYRDNRFEEYGAVNVSVAVAAGDATVLPTLFDADRRDAASLSADLAELTAGAAAGTLTAPQMGNGTFTIVALGDDGARTLTPILTPGQAAVLGFGAVAPRALVVGGTVVVHRAVTATLVADQRIVTAAAASRFLARLSELLQAPAAL